MSTTVVLAFVGALGVLFTTQGVVYLLKRPSRHKRVDGLKGAALLGKTERLETVPPLVDRLLGPVLDDLISLFPGGKDRAGTALRLRRSGWRYPSVGDFYAQKVITAALFFLGGAGLLIVLGKPALFFIPLGVGALGLFAPNREVNQALKKRREALYVEMAFTLDRLAVLMRAGLAFQQALHQLSQAPGKGLFLTALRQTMKQVTLGTPLPKALKLMEDALPPEPEVNKFVQRAHQGGPAADALEAQAELMRRRVEHQLLAKGLRSTLLITTVGGAFILPALALEVVGPPIIMGLRIFGS